MKKGEKNDEEKEGEEKKEIQNKNAQSNCQAVSDDGQWKNHAYKGASRAFSPPQIKTGQKKIR